MAVYDCCMFFNENDLYEIRLNSHWNFVDKFIVVEAGETHTGDPKSFNFDHKRFERYKDKLLYVKFDNFQNEIDKYSDLLLDADCLIDRGPTMETDDWIRDHFQANYLYKVLLDIGAKDNDLVYISCLDEIINEDSFSRAKKIFEEEKGYFQGLRPVFGFHFNLYVYKLNLLHKHWSDHVAGMITEFSNFKKILPTTIRDRSMATHPHIENGGYHFTFLDDTDGEKVLAKQKSWAHSRDQYPGQKIKYDNMTIEEALERMFLDYPHKKVDILEETHPKYIVDNLEKFQNYIFKD
jgi:beta-1,4-mannosyl-glycoprotein beta-1,4-N-acetylglucosaminyltransferase